MCGNGMKDRDDKSRSIESHTMLHFGKLNSTCQLDQTLNEVSTLTSPTGGTTPMSTPGHKRKALTSTGSRAKMSRPIQKRTGPDILTPPDLGGLRGIRNQKGSCTINTVLQDCFQIPRITRILESSRHPLIEGLRSLHDSYTST